MSEPWCGLRPTHGVGWCSAADHTLASLSAGMAGSMVVWGRIWEKPGLVAYSFNSSAREAEAVSELNAKHGLPWNWEFQDSQAVKRKRVSKTNKKQKLNKKSWRAGETID